jgi:hypothetical protein
MLHNSFTYISITILQKFQHWLFRMLMDPVDEVGHLGIAIGIRSATSTNHKVCDTNQLAIVNSRTTRITVARSILNGRIETNQSLVVNAKCGTVLRRQNGHLVVLQQFRYLATRTGATKSRNHNSGTSWNWTFKQRYGVGVFVEIQWSVQLQQSNVIQEISIIFMSDDFRYFGISAVGPIVRTVNNGVRIWVGCTNDTVGGSQDVLVGDDRTATSESIVFEQSDLVRIRGLIGELSA